MYWERVSGYVGDVGITTTGKTTPAILVGHLIPMSPMYGYAHAVKSTIGKTGIAIDAIVNTKDRCFNYGVRGIHRQVCD